MRRGVLRLARLSRIMRISGPSKRSRSAADKRGDARGDVGRRLTGAGGVLGPLRVSESNPDATNTILLLSGCETADRVAGRVAFGLCVKT